MAERMNTLPQEPSRYAPRLVFWETTAGCNLRCIHCRRIDVADGLVPDDLTTEEARGLVDQIVAFSRPILVLSGGEPLFRADIFDIARYAVGRGLKVALATNATLVDARTAARVAAAGISRVSVSFDGADAATHDSFRALPGAFDMAVAGSRALRESGLSLQINTTVARHNHRQMSQIFDLALALGADALHLFLLVPVGCGTDIADEQMLWPAEDEDVLCWLSDRAQEGALEVKATCAPHYQRVIRQRTVAQRRAGVAPASGDEHGGHGGGHPPTRGCLAGTGVFFVSHKGEVYPCGYLPVRAGSVREEPLEKIWSQAEVFQKLRDVDLLEGKCGLCEFKRVCAGCRARAFGANGNYLGEEPFCVHQPRPRDDSYAPSKGRG